VSNRQDQELLKAFGGLFLLLIKLAAIVFCVAGLMHAFGGGGDAGRVFSGLLVAAGSGFVLYTLQKFEQRL
jgi:hypothetical protein